MGYHKKPYNLSQLRLVYNYSEENERNLNIRETQ